MITYRISINFSKKRFSGMLSVLQFSIFLVSSFIEDFFHLFISFFISFQQKNEIKKGNTLMEFKYLLFYSSIDLFDVKISIEISNCDLIRKCA